MVVARLRAAGCVFAEEEAAVLASTAASPAELDAMVARRAGGEPLEQVVGWAEFAGLRVFVDPGVFVPRRRSEFLVEVAVAAGRPAGRHRAPRRRRPVLRHRRARARRSGQLAGESAQAVDQLRRGRPALMSGSAVSNCTRPTWTRPPSRARGGTSRRRRARVRGRPVHGAAGLAAGPDRRADLQRALRADHGDRVHACRGARPRGADGPGRRGGRAGHPPAGRGRSRRRGSRPAACCWWRRASGRPWRWRP